MIYRQSTEYTCVPATIITFLGLMGIDLGMTDVELGNWMGTTKDGTDLAEEMAFLDFIGIEMRELNYAQTIRALSTGQPLYMDYVVSSGERHASLLMGRKKVKDDWLYKIADTYYGHLEIPEWLFVNCDPKLYVLLAKEG